MTNKLYPFPLVQFMKWTEKNEKFHLNDEQISEEIDEYLKERYYLKSADDGVYINEEQPNIDFSMPEIKKKKIIEVTEITYGRTKRNTKPGLF
jgi:hypothetical protein